MQVRLFKEVGNSINVCETILTMSANCVRYESSKVLSWVAVLHFDEIGLITDWYRSFQPRFSSHLMSNQIFWLPSLENPPVLIELNTVLTIIFGPYRRWDKSRQSGADTALVAVKSEHRCSAGGCGGAGGRGTDEFLMVFDDKPTQRARGIELTRLESNFLEPCGRMSLVNTNGCNSHLIDSNCRLFCHRIEWFFESSLPPYLAQGVF